MNEKKVLWDDFSISAFNFDPNLCVWFRHKAVALPDVAVVVKGRLEGEVLQQGYDDRQGLKSGEFVAWKKIKNKV